MKTRLFVISLLPLLLSACVGTQQLTYLSTGSFPSEQESTTDVLVPGDELFIRVLALDARAVEMFNAPSIPGLEANYRISDAGMLYLPSLGSIYVAGLSQIAAQDTLTQRLASCVKDPIVLVKRANAFVTVLGEVRGPGRYMMRNPITLLELLGIAGDITTNGRRDNILVIRKEDGKIREYRLNMLDKNVMTSPAFFLQKDDVVYVAPRRAKRLY